MDFLPMLSDLALDIICGILLSQVILKRREEFKQILMEGKTPTNPEDEFITRRRRAFLDMLLYYHLVEGSMGIEDIQEEVNTFMFAGHDSSALLLYGTMYMLALHPNLQQRVWEELDEIYGDDLDRPITLEDTKKMKYMDCVFKETLRLYSGIPFIGRYISEDVKIGKQTIPAGSNVIVLTYMLHKHPDVYPDPEIYDPDRFLSQNINQRHSFAFLGFSAGPRNCV
ncbi:CYP4V2, partial [Cordylochernes scorpioides]